MRPIDWTIVGDLVDLSYPDGSVVKVKKTDFNRAFGTIINAKKEDIVRDFAVN